MKRILIKQDLLTNYTQCFPPQGRTCTCLYFNLHSRAPLLQLQLINLILNTLLLMQFPAMRHSRSWMLCSLLCEYSVMPAVTWLHFVSPLKFEWFCARSFSKQIVWVEPLGIPGAPLGEACKPVWLSWAGPLSSHNSVWPRISDAYCPINGAILALVWLCSSEL